MWFARFRGRFRWCKQHRRFPVERMSAALVWLELFGDGLLEQREESESVLAGEFGRVERLVVQQGAELLEVGHVVLPA